MFSYKEAVDYLNSLINYEKKSHIPYNRRSFNLERMRVILSKLGNPHKSLKCIHIAGTKGKGSTAAMVTSILSAEGYKVGLYTSPHLISPRERVRIGSRLISEEEFASCMSLVKSAVEELSCKGYIKPTFFEAYTSLAFAYFYQKKVDFAIVEVGLGGRLDATNVIEPLVGIITPISLDHTNILGNDIISIAKEKAGIIKSGSKIIISPQENSAFFVLKKICEEKGATFYQVGKDIKFKILQATSRYFIFQLQGLSSFYPSLFLPLAGEHQLLNAATAVGAVELLKDFGFKISKRAIERGLRRVKWPGRMQVLKYRPTILVDCAHNGASANYLAEFLKKFFLKKRKNLILILAILKNKDVEGIAKPLCPLASKIIITRANSPRALPQEEILSKIKVYCPSKPMIEENINLALKRARQIARKKDVICITGSIYIVGEVFNLPEYKRKIFL